MTDPMHDRRRGDSDEDGAAKAAAVGSGGTAVAQGAAADGAELTADQALARLRAVFEQLDGLEPRLAETSGEVQMTLLEQATELVEEAGRLLERLGRLTG